VEQYLNTPIKKVIEQFPAVENILNEYQIGCALCQVGTCLLKDIVGIHNLSEEEEHALLARIANVIYPDRAVSIPKVADRRKPSHVNYSPPMQKLVREHTLIKRMVSLIPKQIERLDLASPAGRERVLLMIDFIRTYADKYHHAKEEDILFKYFDETLDMLQVMYHDHTTARNHVKAILEGIDHRDAADVATHLTGYHDLLPEHIRKEDDVLYVWMDRNLSTTQVGELFSKFTQVDHASPGVQEKYETIVLRLEQQLNA